MTPTRGALEGRGWTLPVPHALRRRDRALSDEAARLERRRFRLHLRSISASTSRALSAELTRSLDKLKSGNARTPALSPSLLKMLTEAWTIGSIDYDAGRCAPASPCWPW